MARFRRKARRVYSAVKTAYKRARAPSVSVMDVLLAGALYGAIRPTVANMLPTFFKFGPVDSDNVILAGAGYFASKNSNKLIKSIGLIAMGTEAGIVTSGLIAPAVQQSAVAMMDY